MHRKLIAACTVALLLGAGCARADTVASSASAMDHYQHVQQIRDQARDIAGRQAGEADLKRAAALLDGALAYLARPDVSELATGNNYLYMRSYDVCRELAAIYARLGMREQALSTLEVLKRLAWIPAIGVMLAHDPDFASLRDEPRFQALLADFAMPDTLWDAKAIATPYRDKLSVEERVAGLSLFWAEARQNFVHFDNVPELDWNRVYMDYLSKVIAAESTRDYYQVMRTLAPLLHDGHTNIYAPPELADELYARPPLRTALVQDRVLVQLVRSPALAQRVHVGDEIVAIDGMPVRTYAEQRVAPFVSSSTPQDQQVRMYDYELLLGAAAVPLKLRLRAADGSEREENVERSGYTDIASLPQFEFRMLPGGVAYFSLDHFESDAGVKAFKQLLPQILQAKALVIDVRRNGGGSSNYGYDILSYLSRDPIPGSLSFWRTDDAFMRAQRGNMVKWSPLPARAPSLTHARDQVFTGPVALLIGPRTFSAGEDFVVAFDQMKRGPIVGEATGGSTGQPLLFKLPGGGQARICVKYDTYADGREFVGKGIAPTVAAAPTVESFRAGRDVALEQALAALGTKQ